MQISKGFRQIQKWSCAKNLNLDNYETATSDWKNVQRQLGVGGSNYSILEKLDDIMGFSFDKC